MRMYLSVACAMGLTTAAIAGPSVPTVLYSDNSNKPDQSRPGARRRAFPGFRSSVSQPEWFVVDHVG